MLPALLSRWKPEQDPRAKASLLAALGALDLKTGKATATKALKDREPAVRAAAGLVLLWLSDWWPKSRVKWPKDAAEAVASAFTDSDPLEHGAWSSNALGEIIDAFAGQESVPEPMLRLLPLLRAGRTSGTLWMRSVAARALWRLADKTAAELTPAILPSPEGFEQWQHHAMEKPLDLIAEMRAAHVVPQLEALLALDGRIRSGDSSNLVRADERLQARLRGLTAHRPERSPDAARLSALAPAEAPRDLALPMAMRLTITTTTTRCGGSVVVRT